MAYFANGTEGDMYKEQYCSRCIHGGGDPCAVMIAHLLHNYDECNKADSLLHLLIPRKQPPEYGNEQCTMFVSAEPKEPT